MKKLMIFVALVLVGAAANAQQFFTRDAKVKFDATATTSPEKIEGVTSNGTCVLDAATGRMQWAVLVKGFQFEKYLMQEHFNENYMESDQYPKASFSGKITNLGEINFSKDGTYNAVVTGQITVHGVSKDFTTNGALTVSGGKVKLNAGFSLALADFKIEIPSLVSDKIAKEAKVLIDATLDVKK